MTFDLQKLVRPNIWRLKPYSSARSEFAGSAEVFLDANENAFASPGGIGYNRYPDPLQTELKERIGALNEINPAKIFVGNGSDEAIDLLFRIFCRPEKDACILCPPTYGMYRVAADTNDVDVVEVPLTSEFQLNPTAILTAATSEARLIFICSPNNPTGNLMRREDIMRIAAEFNGIVVVDEAYIHFADVGSIIAELDTRPNLVVLQTFSKAWGMAGLRVGLAFASEAIIDLMNRVKPPYNVSGIAQRAVMHALEQQPEINVWVAEILRERDRLIAGLGEFEFVKKIYPTDANFLLAKTTGAEEIYNHLICDRVVVRNRSSVELCEGCLRITVGTADENARLLASLEEFQSRS